MHPALAIPEILEHVFKNLPPADLGRCTVICRLFYQEALPLLWEEVTLADCAQLLPGVSCSEIAVEGFGAMQAAIRMRGQPPVDRPRYHVNVRRQLQPADWERFQFHATFIKHLRLPASTNHAELFSALEEGPPEAHLFRNLRKLEIEEVEPSHKRYAFINLFASPTVREVDIRNSRPDRTLVGSIVPRIPECFPSLSSLAIHIPSYTVPPSDTLLTTVEKYPSLSILEVRTSPQEVGRIVEIAAKMENLHHATFMGVGSTDFALPSDSFMSLVSLTLEGRGVAGIGRIISAVASSSLTELAITWTPEANLEDPSLSLDRFNQLKILRLNAPTSFFSTSYLSPTFNCNTLEEVYIRGNSDDFTQTLLSTMAQAWPRLRHLELMPAGPVSGSLPHLSWFKCFATHCPNLESLAARATLVTEEHPRQAGGGEGKVGGITANQRWTLDHSLAQPY